MQVELVAPTSFAKPRSKMFPVLVFLLMACYGIMTLVVIEQGHVIQSQRSLIMQLFQDSQQLTSLKGQEGTQRAIEKKQAEAAAKTKPKHASPMHAVPMPKEQPQGLMSGKSHRAGSRQASKMEKDKQPMQAVDKLDRRRFPSEI
jgi:hypothetical protein